MKKFFAVLMMLGFVAASTAALADDMKMDDGKAKKETLTGTLVDIACYLDDGDTGNDHGGMTACGTECLKGGSPAGLLVGKKLYILAFPAGVFANYVGQNMELTGTVYGDTNFIPVKAAVVDKDGKKKDVNIKGKSMM